MSSEQDKHISISGHIKLKLKNNKGKENFKTVKLSAEGKTD